MTFQGKQYERTLENVKKFWDETAALFQTDPRGTIRDVYFQQLEIQAIRKLILGRKNVLDIGCGNGYATLYYSQDVEHIIGMDYCGGWIQAAQKLMKNFPVAGVHLRENVTFQVGNILELPFADGGFDAVVCERVLINLPSWELQQQALQELCRVLQPGGLLVCVEVTEDGHAAVNAYRRKFGLEDLEKYWHNLYLEEERFLKYMQQLFSLQEVKRFGMYQFLSKVVHPLLVAPEQPKFESKFNEVARKIAHHQPEFEDCSHQVMFVLEKR